MLSFWEMSFPSLALDVEAEDTQRGDGVESTLARVGEEMIESDICFKTTTRDCLVCVTESIFPSRKFNPTCPTDVIVDHEPAAREESVKRRKRRGRKLPKDKEDIALISLSSNRTIALNNNPFIKCSLGSRDKGRHGHEHLDEVTSVVTMIAKKTLMIANSFDRKHTRSESLFVPTSTVTNLSRVRSERSEAGRPFDQE
jgi:hypothetical protein